MIELYFENGEVEVLSFAGWQNLLFQAYHASWMPMGTRGPADLPSDAWDGNYIAGDNQTVSAADAENLAAALDPGNVRYQADGHEFMREFIPKLRSGSFRIGRCP